MKKYFNRTVSLVAAVFFIAALASCGLFKSSRRPADAPYIKGGINFHLRGDQNLNLYQKSPHALVLCAYQLRGVSAFNQMAEEKDGLNKLLECGRFDPSVTYAKKLIVQPGQDIYEAMEKADDSKYVALIAGFYNFQKRQAIKVITLPMKGIPLFRRPGGMDIKLYLSAQTIEDFPRE
jgi:hypothetical protein